MRQARFGIAESHGVPAITIDVAVARAAFRQTQPLAEGLDLRRTVSLRAWMNTLGGCARR
jgi:hypothetical protein